jgi:glucan biosynthesis protein
LRAQAGLRGWWTADATADEKAGGKAEFGFDKRQTVFAYRFVIQRTSGVVMEIEQTLFFRKTVERLGLAPLTSMYWYSETVKPTAVDWRPEVHDSDGLAIWTDPASIFGVPLSPRPILRYRAFLTNIRAGSA